MQRREVGRHRLHEHRVLLRRAARRLRLRRRRRLRLPGARCALRVQRLDRALELRHLRRGELGRRPASVQQLLSRREGRGRRARRVERLLGLQQHGGEEGAGGVEAGVGRGRVGERQVVVQLEVDEGEQALVELEEGEHHAVVDGHRRLLRERVRLDPRERDAGDLRLVVDALDRDEDLAQRARARNVGVELALQTLGVLDARRRHKLGRGEGGEEEGEAERVV
mmetsp:Transcript_69679/g.185438  ORF Transcript_69679/g.185438 Transcript_69679/m.185438 type:complete len:224 (-) Transcript_69679:118-789(-)